MLGLLHFRVLYCSVKPSTEVFLLQRPVLVPDVWLKTRQQSDKTSSCHSCSLSLLESAQWPIADCTWRELCSYEGLGSGPSKVKAFSPSTWVSSFPLKSPGLGAQPRAYILDCLRQVDGWILWSECGQTELDMLVGGRANKSHRQRQTSVRLQALYRYLTPVSCAGC